MDDSDFADMGRMNGDSLLDERITPGRRRHWLVECSSVRLIGSCRDRELPAAEQLLGTPRRV
jgi:hypothetical protein